MNLENNGMYSRFALCREMLQTGEFIKSLDVEAIQAFAKRVKHDSVLLSGEGSSRIFPAKKNLRDAHRLGYKGCLYTEAATQAMEYDLSRTTVFVASNSGRTKECIRLIRHLREKKHDSIIGVVSTDGTPVQQESDIAYVLQCGKEQAVAATKSVMEQALFYEIVLRTINERPLPDLARLGAQITETLQAPLPAEVAEAIFSGGFLYWAGRNDGVAEELTLKTNEITRRKSDFLEGTYAAHGIEEVMERTDVVIVVDPYPEEEQKFTEVLVKGVGMKVVAIAPRKTSFPTFIIPDAGDSTPYLELAAGWNMMVEIGIRNGINLDKPQRARKVGNEFVG